MTPWTIACQAPLSVGFPRQEYWSELPFPSPVDLPDPGVEPASPVLAGFLTTPHLCIHLYTEKMILTETNFPDGWMCHGH